jgi:hypothetical protein
MLLPPIIIPITRPADTNAYAAGDTIADSTSAPTAPSAVLLPSPSFQACCYLVEARLMTNKADFVPRLRWHLYGVAPPAVADNAALPILWADIAKRRGFIDMPALEAGPTGSDMTHTLWRDVPKPLYLPTGVLWPRAQLLDAATPASGQVFSLVLTIDVP